jgi:hypothetical protein
MWCQPPVEQVATGSLFRGAGSALSAMFPEAAPGLA